jgi:hypothetical protein
MQSDDDKKQPDKKPNESRPKFSEKSIAARYPKGKSGNPKGRPKGSKNRAIIAAAEVSELIPITENGHRQKITKWHAGFKQQVNNAVMGNLAAYKAVEETLDRLGVDRLLGPDTKESAQPQGQEPMTLEEANRIYNEEIKGDQSSQ